MPDEERVESDSPSEEEQTNAGGEGSGDSGSGGSEEFPNVSKTPNPGGPNPLPYPDIADVTQGKMEGEESSGAEESREKPREEEQETKDSKAADNTDSGSFLANSGDIVLDADISDEGRKRLAKEDAGVSQRKFDLQDEEINVSAMERQPANEKAEEKPVEPAESMPEHDSPENFGKKPIESMPAPDLSEHFREIDEDDPFYIKPSLDIPGDLEPSETSEPIEIVKDPTTEPLPMYLNENADEDDWNEPEDRLDKADMHDEDEDDEED